MFEKITRKKVRFESPRGLLSIEDVWDLPLRKGMLTLDDMAKNLSKELRDNEESFVSDKKEVKIIIMKLKFKAIKHIIGVKLKDEEACKKKVENKKKYETIVDVLAEKERKDLKGQSDKALRKRLKKYKSEDSQNS